MSTPPPQAILVITNLPDQASAESLAGHLLEARLAACVNIMAACSSVYNWQNALQKTAEIPLFIKTTAERYAQLEQAIRARHPYELPEIICLPVRQGLPAYLDWVRQETEPPCDSC